MRPRRFEIVVIGSGFAGSLLAAALRRRGRRVLLLERGRHPRFAIGESTTPLTNLLLEEIADEFGLSYLRPLSKWGTWQEERPELACGLKRGFTFYKHDLGRRFPRGRERSRQRQLMVGASPNERVADTHWYRPDFDAFLVAQAVGGGVVFEDRTEVESVTEGGACLRVRGVGPSGALDVIADFVVDASGPRGCLHRLFRLPEGRAAGFPDTQSLYAHFSGVGRLAPRFVPGTPPYPHEEAAVHHLFDGGWLWALRFNNGVTSAGVVATAEAARRLRLGPGEEGWRRVLSALPSLADCFASARAVTPFYWQPKVAFQSAVVHGRRWALLPSAAGVIDPLLSTGFPLNLLGVQRLARLLGGPKRGGFARALGEYGRATTREFEATASLVKALYGKMSNFKEFRELILAYFAAASYAEASRRLGKASRVPDFLLCRHPWFGPRLTALCRPSLRGRRLSAQVREAIAPIDVLGLTDATRVPWFPALTDDLFRNAGKLGARPEEIAAMLSRCGM
jgi:FADH2 O2-dependent halogenase